MTGIKYALLLLPAHSDDAERAELDAATSTWVGALGDLIDGSQVKHWREWLGTLRWEEVEKRQRLVLTQMPSERPEVLDAENKQLGARLVMPWRALPLAAPIPSFSGKGVILSGEAANIEGELRLRSVREVSELDSVVRPYYATRPQFWRSMRGHSPDNGFQRWVDLDALLLGLSTRGLPDILHVALRAFGNALGRDGLEFRIPDFVRAAECVLAVPRGRGAEEFAQRAARIAPGLAEDDYIRGGDLRTRLVTLYQNRNDCVHGKVPFQELHRQGDEGDDEAARLEYVAERVAREALLVALRAVDKHDDFRDRDTLEAAWETGRFP